MPEGWETVRVIGLDPGKSGGIAVVGNGLAECWPMGATEGDVWDLLYDIRNNYGGASMALLEKVHAMPGQGVTSMFNFGMNYGMLRAFLVAAGIPFETVTPQAWQKHFGLIRKDKTESNTDKKNRHKAKAQELFPGLTITHKTADALLIAQFGLKVRST